MKTKNFQKVINETSDDLTKLVSLQMDYLDLKHQADQLAEVLRVAMASLATYGSHPLIEHQAKTALTNYEQNNKTK